MNKSKGLRFFFLSLAVVILIGGFSIVGSAMFAEPGSEEDPIITLSYLEQRIGEIKNYIDENFQQFSNEIINVNTTIGEINEKIDELSEKSAGNINNNVSSSTSGTQAVFEVVFAEAGKFVYYGESTEVIVRSGKALAIQSESGGLTDVTAGKDIKANEEVPLNHLIIIPRNDGRGMSIQADSYLMIKGSYTIQ